MQGGLGNQMFQYAASRSLSLRSGAELILDDWSGFIRDSHYRRNFELDKLPINARRISPIERIPIWLFRYLNRKTEYKSVFIEDRCYGRFINEYDHAFHPELLSLTMDRSIWITGYWQSPLYFKEFEYLLYTELCPQDSQNNSYKELASRLHSSESVAIGIRLYEESVNPAAQARDGKVKSFKDLKKTINELKFNRPNSKFFLFCTHRSESFNELDLPSDTEYVTNDDGFSDSIDTLWLLSNCRHHIFLNSSYFWWGAWLSKYKRGNEVQFIYASDNFLNRNFLCDGWKMF